MKKLLAPLLKKQRLLILGFGKEGQSTFRYIRANFPGLPFGIADSDANLKERFREQTGDPLITLHTGDDYLSALPHYGLIIKSPGVKIPGDIRLPDPVVLTSQTHLMLHACHRQIIGITGTKGKSTTSSLIHHILKTSGMDTVLVGNIGLPPFDYLEQISENTRIVFEMSSHQLEDSILAPRIAVLLNLFPEHLDRYPSLEAYYTTKMRIVNNQIEGDIFIYNEDIPGISTRISEITSKRKYFSFSSGFQMKEGCYLSDRKIILCHNGSESEFIEVTGEFPLRGRHNLMNMMAAILATLTAGAGIDAIREGLKTFRGLEHRLEYAGEFEGIHYYNDSIATIPEAAIAALKALPDTDTIILGGFDRGLDYSELVDFLSQSHIHNFIFLGKAGARICDGLTAVKKEGMKLFKTDSLEEAFPVIRAHTQKGRICLLSPAAASYDIFRNFEERGRLFKKLARGSVSC